MYAHDMLKLFIKSSVSDLGPFYFGQPDLFHEMDPDRKKSAKIMENVVSPALVKATIKVHNFHKSG